MNTKASNAWNAFQFTLRTLGRTPEHRCLSQPLLARKVVSGLVVMGLISALANSGLSIHCSQAESRTLPSRTSQPKWHVP